MASGSDKKKTKLDQKVPDDIKEKVYVTRQVDTSITILDSRENDVVLESLLFLSKYADIKLNNLTYLQQKGIMQKLLNLFDRNICILRLALRLLNVLLDLDDVLIEIDQEKYDEKILAISNFFISHTDVHVREFCIDILSKLALSCRMTNLIFRIDLINPILNTIKTTKNMNVLESTIKLFFTLLSAPATLSILVTAPVFDVSVILSHTQHQERSVQELCYKIIERLTSFVLSAFQQKFRQVNLVQKMLDVVMDPDKKDFHVYALNIVQNCMQSEETFCYFVESSEFLNFCQWVKTCDPEYLLACITILERLTQIPQMKQVLFDLSVEDSILYIFRSNDKQILNTTCEAISNMSEHKYCCDKMVTAMTLQSILAILDRKDDIDPDNAVAIKTLHDLSRRSIRTTDILYSLGAAPTMLDYFRKGDKVLGEETFLQVAEMIFRFAVHPEYQKGIISEKIFMDLFKQVLYGSDQISVLAVEILTYFIKCPSFNENFRKLDGPNTFVNILKTTTNKQLRKFIALFIHSSILYGGMGREFLHSNIINTIKGLSELKRLEIPLLQRIENLIYDMYLPLKLFKTRRLEITDKLSSKFYLVTGYWNEPFPFLEILTAEERSTLSTIYVVDYSLTIKPGVRNPDRSLENTQTYKSFISTDTTQTTSVYEINYGNLSEDPYLPRYIYHVSKYLDDEMKLETKIRILAEYVDALLSGPEENATIPQQIHTFKTHIESIKTNLGTNLIPVGFLRMGFHCERALLFKAIGDQCCIPCSLVRGTRKVYWNEVASLETNQEETILKFYVVDLMNNIGNLLLVGSREANQYCDIKF